MFGTIIVIRNGLTLPGPRSFMTLYSRSQVESPPMPLPITIATRSGLSRIRSDYPRALRGLYARGYAKLGEAVHPAGLLLAYEVGGVEIPALTGDPRRIRGRVEERDLPDPALAVQGRIPEVLRPRFPGASRPRFRL